MTLTNDLDLRTLTGTWDIDPTHSSLEFAAKHAMVTTVRGRFNDFSGVIEIDGENPARSSAEVHVQVGSVDSRSADRDNHLRSADFFDVETYPEIVFKSTRAEVRADGEYRLYGDLTIKDVTREVAVDLTFTGLVADPWGNDRIGFEGEAKVNRKDWGLTWNMALEAGGLLVGEKVKILVDVAAVRRK